MRHDVKMSPLITVSESDYVRETAVYPWEPYPTSVECGPYIMQMSSSCECMSKIDTNAKIAL